MTPEYPLLDTKIIVGHIRTMTVAELHQLRGRVNEELSQVPKAEIIPRAIGVRCLHLLDDVLQVPSV